VADLGPPTTDREGGWTFALLLDDLWEGDMVGVGLGNADVLLVNLGDGEIVAYDNRCPHAGSRLSEGRLSTTTLRCGSHLWEFDVRTGDGVNPRNCMLRKYAVKVVDGAIMVRLGG
jgi:toluene monooxygenase system ferredoxin subunit